MPYFVILPCFAAAVLGWGCALCLCAVVPRLRRALPCGWRMLVGSSVGFLVANLASLLVGVVPVLCAAALGVDRDSAGAPVVAGFALLGLFVGPLIASPLGFLGGAWIARRRFARARPATG
jgi:hypothetical protein